MKTIDLNNENYKENETENSIKTVNKSTRTFKKKIII